MGGPVTPGMDRTLVIVVQGVMTKRRLPLLCPSNAGGGKGFHMKPCEEAPCAWWAEGACSASLDLEKDYEHRMLPLRTDRTMPPCKRTEQCRWHIEAVNRGHMACPPRRLGEVCEHQGGEWNTFDMMPADDEDAWGRLDS